MRFKFKVLDRYLLRELSFPFLLALVGFLIFILLNLILSMRDWMIDRGISFWMILRLLLYQVPWFLVFSIPVATVFAVFLALGRLSHDREIIAMQAGGVSLKRIVLPILLAGLLLSGLDLWISDSLVPWANREYQRTFSRLLLRRATTPQIRDNTFFRDSAGRVLYIRHYDRERGLLEGIMIYDLSGHSYPGLPAGSSSYPVAILAREGAWQGQQWVLRDGVIHQFDPDGHLIRELSFKELQIDVGRSIETLLMTQRTPQEMSLKELQTQIAHLRAAGLNADNLVLEFHAKIAIPLAGLVFALFSAPLALIFSMRSRAAGAVISVLLIGLFQGTMIWAQTLGRRGIIDPVLGAWLPDLLFGMLGLVLYLKMEDWSRRDFGERLRRLVHRSLIPGFLILFLFFLISLGGGLMPVLGGRTALAAQISAVNTTTTQAQSGAVKLRADKLTVTQDLSEIEAKGHVRVFYSSNNYDNEFATDWARLLHLRSQTDATGYWQLWARGAVRAKLRSPGARITATARELEARLNVVREGQENQVELERVAAQGLRGDYLIIKSQTDSSSYSYAAKRAVAKFSSGDLIELQLHDAAELRFPNGALQAERIELRRSPDVSSRSRDGEWRVAAQGEVRLTGSGRDLQAGYLTADLRPTAGGFALSEIVTTDFRGSEQFINAQGERQRLRYQGLRATLSFTGDESSKAKNSSGQESLKLRLLKIDRGSFTTCSCSEILAQDAYCISAGQLLIFSDDLLVASDIVLRVFGVPIFWAPFYVAPLKKERKSPLLPEFGHSALRGWYARWRWPLVLDERNNGLLLLDYYNRYRQLGTGLDLNYSLFGGSGRVYLYKIFGVAGLLELSLSNKTILPQGVTLSVSAAYRRQEGVSSDENRTERRTYRAQLAGSRDGWNWGLSFSREERKISQSVGPGGTQTASERLLVLERLPEFSLRYRSKLGLLNYNLGLSWGRYHERFVSERRMASGKRFNGALGLNLQQLSIRPGLKLQAAGGYQLTLYEPRSRRDLLYFTPSLSWTPLTGLQIGMNYNYRWISGRTPFSFDQQQAANAAVFKGSWRLAPDWRIGLSMGYDLLRTRFAPLIINANWYSKKANIALSFNYDLNDNRARKLTLQASFTDADAGWSAVLLSGYDLLNTKWDDLIIKLSWGRERLGLRYDLNKLYLKRVNAELSWDFASNWSLGLKGEFDLLAGRFTRFQYSLVRRFCNCWELGLYGERGRIWLQAQILAFPTAGIKYSPTDQALAFGS